RLEMHQDWTPPGKKFHLGSVSPFPTVCGAVPVGAINLLGPSQTAEKPFHPGIRKGLERGEIPLSTIYFAIVAETWKLRAENVLGGNMVGNETSMPQAEAAKHQ